MGTMNITNRIRRSVRARPETLFRPADFAGFGSTASVKRALQALTAAGVLVRLGVGIYAKAKPSVLTGEPIPAQPVEVLGPLALTMLGVDVRPSRLTERYNSGAMTQIPAGVVVNIGQQRVTRKIGFNGKFLRYERG